MIDLSDVLAEEMSRTACAVSWLLVQLMSLMRMVPLAIVGVSELWVPVLVLYRLHVTRISDEGMAVYPPFDPRSRGVWIESRRLRRYGPPLASPVLAHSADMFLAQETWLIPELLKAHTPWDEATCANEA